MLASVARLSGAALLGAVLLVLAGGAHAQTITLRADEWCPYNCAPDADRPGYMIEIAREVFGGAGHRVDYRALSWVRSVEETRAGRYTAIVGATRDEAPGFVFPQRPLGMNSDGFVVRRGVSFRYDGPDSFDGLIVGAIRGYGYAGALGEYIAAHASDRSRVQLTAGNEALARNLRKLAAGRVDVVVDDLYVLCHTMRDLGLEDVLEIADHDLPDPVYIAFSPVDPRATEYALLLDAGIAGLRASGRLAEILARYGLTDWE